MTNTHELLAVAARICDGGGGRGHGAAAAAADVVVVVVFGRVH